MTPGGLDSAELELDPGAAFGRSWQPAQEEQEERKQAKQLGAGDRAEPGPEELPSAWEQQGPLQTPLLPTHRGPPWAPTRNAAGAVGPSPHAL